MKKIHTEERVTTAMSEIAMWNELILEALNSLHSVRQVLSGDELMVAEKVIFKNIGHYAKKITDLSESVEVSL